MVRGHLVRTMGNHGVHVLHTFAHAGTTCEDMWNAFWVAWRTILIFWKRVCYNDSLRSPTGTENEIFDYDWKRCRCRSYLAKSDRLLLVYAWGRSEAQNDVSPKTRAKKALFDRFEWLAVVKFKQKDLASCWLKLEYGKKKLKSMSTIRSN